MSLRLSVVLTLALAACGPTRTAFQNPANRADASLTRSFRALPVDAPADHADRAQLTLSKSALEKEFLLNASLLIQSDAPTPRGQQSRVVFFRRAGDKVYLMEASKGLLLTKAYPFSSAIAELPILGEDDEKLVIDFARGMSRLFMEGDWHARDLREGDKFTSARVAFSFVDRAEVIDDKILEIHQKALLDLPEGSLTTSLPVEVVYYLSPYLPDPSFKPTVAPRTFDHFGFAETRTQANDQGGYVVYAGKQNLDKPVTYAISANTPAEFKDAVREGALYWNKAFGREVITVIDAPAGVTAPSAKYNVIQWVDLDLSRFAMADVQMDPRTGEILHQHVYVASGLALAAAEDVDKWQKQNPPAVALAGFNSARLCDYKINRHAASELATHVPPDASPEKILKVKRDLLRKFIAHEVGHTLGLRHNFAGSLAANYPAESRGELFKSYLDQGAVDPGLVISSSMMEYPGGLEESLYGDLMQRRPHVDAHDERALQALYEGRDVPVAELPLFCTDSHLGTFADCQMWDTGSSVVEAAKSRFRENVEAIPYDLYQAFVNAKAPLFGEKPFPVDDVDVNGKIMATLELEDAKTFLDVLRKDGRLLSVARRHKTAGPTDEKEIRRESVAQVESLLNQTLDGVVPKTSPEFVDELAKKFTGLVDRAPRGTNLRGVAYEFTDAELRHMREYGRRFFARFFEDLAEVEVHLLAGASPYLELAKEFGFVIPSRVDKPMDDTPLSYLFAKHLGERMRYFLFATKGAPDVITRETRTTWSSRADEVDSPTETLTLTLSHFTFPFELRKKVVQLLRGDRAESTKWGYREHRRLTAALDRTIQKAVPGANVDDPRSFEEVPHQAIEWLLEMRELKTMLKMSNRFGEFTSKTDN